MSFKVTSEQSSCFLQWLYKYIKFPVNDAELIKSYYGLQSCVFYKGIKIHYSTDLVILDMSGKGCRTLEALNHDLNWYKFLNYFDEWIVNRREDTKQYTVHISRLDVACDLLDDEKITISKIQTNVQKSKFICKSNYHSCVIGNYENAVYFGSPRSDRRLRIYDKSLEQDLQDDVKWLRFEFQLRNDNATSFYLNLKELNGDFTQCYYGMLHDYLRFITTENDGVHIARKVTCRWWFDFLNGVSKISQLYLPGDEYDLGKLTHYLGHQCASSMQTFLQANGGDVTELLNMAQSAKLNKKQKELLDSLENDNNENVIDEPCKPRALTRSEATALYVANAEQQRYEGRFKNWHSLGTSKEQIASNNAERIMSKLAEQDMKF